MRIDGTELNLENGVDIEVTEDEEDDNKLNEEPFLNICSCICSSVMVCCGSFFFRVDEVFDSAF